MLPLFISAQSKLTLPAFTEVKSIKKSTARAALLSVDPVIKRIRLPLPNCALPVEPLEKVVVPTVVFFPSGIVPVEFAATPPNRVAAVGEAKPAVHVAIVEKSSV